MIPNQSPIGGSKATLKKNVRVIEEVANLSWLKLEVKEVGEKISYGE